MKRTSQDGDRERRNYRDIWFKFCLVTKPPGPLIKLFLALSPTFPPVKWRVDHLLYRTAMMTSIFTTSY